MSNKRQRLIDAAFKVFSHKGFNNASIKDIASEADVTPGLVHYYFKNKEELLLSVQNDVQEEYQSQYKNLKESDLTRMDFLFEIQSRVENNPDWYRWRYELYSLGLKGNPSHQLVENILQDGRKSIAHPVKKLVDDSDEADALASILLACFDGLALQKLMDDSFDLDQTYKVLADLLTNYLRGDESLE